MIARPDACVTGNLPRHTQRCHSTTTSAEPTAHLHSSIPDATLRRVPLGRIPKLSAPLEQGRPHSPEASP
ncbi:hypothetical protein GCM10009612_32690 [Streptomyces beijiangensis]